MDKSLLGPSLHVDVHWRCLNLEETLGILTGIAGPRRYLAFALTNGTLYYLHATCTTKIFKLLMVVSRKPEKCGILELLSFFLYLFLLFIFGRRELICCCSWKCHKPGHLAEDCLTSTSHWEANPAGKAYNHVICHDVNENLDINLLSTTLYKRVLFFAGISGSK